MPTIIATKTTVIVNSAHLFAPSGPVGTWCRDTAFELAEAARGLAPPNRTSASPRYEALRRGQSTGELMASIYAETQRVGTHGININYGARAPHTKYVHGGTMNQGLNYIYTTQGYAQKAQIASFVKNKFFEFGKGEAGLVMPLPKIGTKNHLFLRVHGQKANPFLTDAYTLVRLRHRALPAKRFPHTLI